MGSGDRFARMGITVVALDGDETGQELLEQSLRVLDPGVLGIELEVERFDLSLENRRKTEQRGLRRGGGARCARPVSA